MWNEGYNLIILQEICSYIIFLLNHKGEEIPFTVQKVLDEDNIIKK